MVVVLVLVVLVQLLLLLLLLLVLAAAAALLPWRAPPCWWPGSADKPERSCGCKGYECRDCFLLEKSLTIRKNLEHSWVGSTWQSWQSKPTYTEAITKKNRQHCLIVAALGCLIERIPEILQAKWSRRQEWNVEPPSKHSTYIISISYRMNLCSAVDSRLRPLFGSWELSFAERVASCDSAN